MEIFTNYIIELKCLARLALALVLGFLVGYERKKRYKEAGIRTHAIVSFGACLMMIVSKYGFSDVANFDASRIAAQIVTGVGFLGAGMILYRGTTLRGLTTAAGIWTTAGIGMATGAGMYIVAVGATFIIIVFQYVMHLKIGFFTKDEFVQYKISFHNTQTEIAQIKEMFGVEKFVSANFIKLEDGNTRYEVVLTTKKSLKDEDIESMLVKNDYIFSIVKLAENY
ncbi:MAG: MgtC/SapB family protein [Clostridia bacterium]